MRLPRPAAPALLLLAAACRARAGADTVSSEAPTVALRPDNIAVAAVRSLSSGPSISGVLTAVRQATIRAEVAGMVTEVKVEQGQAVTPGQVLARVDDTAIRDAMLSARSAARSAEEALLVARRNAERSERLAQAGALAERDLEQARWSAMNAEAGLADAKARLASAEKQLEKTTIRAPFAGIVSERPINAGDLLQPGNPVLAVVDPSRLRLEAAVPVQALEVLKIGTPVDFEMSGFEGKSFNGRIERINPAVDPATRQVRIYVALPNLQGRLVAGLFAQGRVATEQRETLAVPLSALDLKATSPMVRRLNGGRVELVTIELGLRDDVLQLIEVRNGLRAGDTVLVGPSAGVAEGTPVRITRE